MVIMMKRIEKIFKIALIVAMLFINLPITKAAGTAYHLSNFRIDFLFLNID